MTTDKTTIIYTDDEKELIKLGDDNLKLEIEFCKLFDSNPRDKEKIKENIKQRWAMIKKTINKRKQNDNR